ncbi:hypothetical protein HGG82_10285 [Marinomonas sp. M1K-6]|uniref:Uncharacterized protein n=1 Tax=Marinomonas profundi TaxID=2726122 RepID=A0A847RAM8_9GAMM|nr:hypothetical protein [Marinomonas profundi]NLQ18014.1 hypothetical protein [Marinomonas profundi]UDV01738.1 hypothetical protein J8N69_08915 [Marinomonas profundi]
MNLDEKAAIVAPLGFEPMRLGQLLNSDDGREYSSITGLIAIPAYKVGWENRSIKSNLRHFKKTHQCSLSLCSSLNPYALYQKIDELWDAYEKIILAPLGTKPSTIAISLFLINNFKKNTRKKNISAVYDFPVKSIDRSLGIGKIHLYSMYSTI